jgi:small subunit ribosomal protein S20
MANTKNAKKANRQAEKRRVRNRYYSKTTRNAVKQLREDKKEDATKNLPKVVSMVDRLAGRGVIHRKKASRLKSRLMKKINKAT